jgi:polar amino acid transport system substrate-binding protein
MLKHYLLLPLILGAGAACAQDLPSADSPVHNPFAGSQAAAQAGHALFNETCAHCHGPDAVTGISERNLRHLQLRYGDHMAETFHTTVLQGRLEKGMPTWAGTLDEDTIWKIYTYLQTIQATDD